MGDKLGVITALPQSQIITTAAFAWQSAEGNDREDVYKRQDDAQLKRMISAEAGTYAVSGLVVGIALGLVLNPVSYTHLAFAGAGYTMELLEVNHLCKTYGSGETAVHALKEVRSVSYTHLGTCRDKIPPSRLRRDRSVA